MKKLALLLLIASTPLQAITPPTKDRACLKIGYGICALLAGVASPIMGGYHFLAGKALSELSEKVGNINSKIKEKTEKRPLLGLFSSFTKTALDGTELIIDSQAALQNSSSRFYLANTFFLIPLGVAAIQSGREDLRRLSTDAYTGENGEMQIAGDKAKKS